MRVNADALYHGIAQRIAELRFDYPDGRARERKITQAELSTMSGVARTTITNIEANRQRPPLHLLMQICWALDAKLTDVLPNEVDIFEPQSKSEIPGEDQIPEELKEKLRHFYG